MEEKQRPRKLSKEELSELKKEYNAFGFKKLADGRYETWTKYGPVILSKNERLFSFAMQIGCFTVFFPSIYYAKFLDKQNIDIPMWLLLSLPLL
jgi:hypothetical protein